MTNVVGKSGKLQTSKKEINIDFLATAVNTLCSGNPLLSVS